LGCALSEEALIPEERTTNILEIDDTAGMAAEINEISKKASMDTANDGSSESASEAEPMDVEERVKYMPRGMTRIWGPVARTKQSRRRWRTLTGSSW
jgi:hypothetical protein